MSHLALGMTGAAMGAVLAAYAIVRIRHWRRKSPDEIERLRRLELHRRGRITHGQIVDVLDSTPDSPPRLTVVYSYEVAGVSYEVGQDVTALSGLASRAHALAGRNVSVKYDRKQPANSIVACEDWSGVTKIDPSIH